MEKTLLNRVRIPGLLEFSEEEKETWIRNELRKLSLSPVESFEELSTVTV